MPKLVKATTVPTLGVVKCMYAECKGDGVGSLSEKAPHIMMCRMHRIEKCPEGKQICIDAECGTHASYGIICPLYCSRHAPIEQENVVNRRCAIDKCRKLAQFGDKFATHCIAHRGDLPRRRNPCSAPGCVTSNSSTGPDGRKWCSKHKPEGSKPHTAPKKPCDDPDCEKHAIYITPTGQWCKAHNTDKYACCKRAQCAFPGCIVAPTFGTGRKKTHCAEHSDPLTMKAVRSAAAMCEVCGLIRAGFGIGKATRCKEHSEGMPAIGQIICSNENCGTVAMWGITKKERCWAHKLEGMVHMGSKKCSTCDKVRATFGFPQQPATKCTSHKEDGMVKDPMRRCKVKGCNNFALVGPPNGQRRHCELHGNEEDTCNFIEKPCTVCKQIDVLDEHDKCKTCTAFNDKKHLAKQRALFAYLNAVGLPGHSDDKVYDASCGKERPDRIYDFGHVVIIVECDERQHSHIQQSCEDVRMFNIAQMIAAPKTVFLRWNPDKYTSSKPNTVLKRRHETCAKFIEAIRDKTLDIVNGKGAISYIKLFYNGWEGPASAVCVGLVSM